MFLRQHRILYAILILCNCYVTFIKYQIKPPKGLNESGIDAMKGMAEKDRLIWEDEKKQLCGRLLERCNIRLLDVGRK